jgi:hypothetical protein
MSDIDTQYNCIAYAAGVTDKKWWPQFHPDYYWPPNAPRVNSLISFIAVFRELGYEVCEDGAYEVGFEKVAFYTRNGVPTHAARQIGPDRWESKLGNWYDIEHTTDAVSSGDYGRMDTFMKRALKPKG